MHDLAEPSRASPDRLGRTEAGDCATPVDLDLGRSLAVRLMDTTKQDVREVADEEGLRSPSSTCLRRLRHHGPTPMRRLAEQMNCEASNLTGLVDRLESRGLVERRPDPGDRRVRLLALTDEGRRVSQEAWVAVARRCPLTHPGARAAGAAGPAAPRGLAAVGSRLSGPASSTPELDARARRRVILHGEFPASSSQAAH